VKCEEDKFLEFLVKSLGIQKTIFYALEEGKE
jgi:hypothetical protein